MLVVDASVGVHALFGECAVARAARRRVSGEDLAVPHLFDAEIVSAARRLVLSGTLDASVVAARLARLGDFDVDRYPHPWLAERAFPLRDSLTAYDAMYVALAETLDCVLLTLDGRLARSHGHRATVELFAA